MDNKKNAKIILLQKLKDGNQLTEKELALKQKLQEIEKTFLSTQKVISEIYSKNKNTIYNCQSFDAFIHSIALTQAMTIITEFFGIDVDCLNDLFDD